MQDLLSPLFRRPLVCLTLLWATGIVLATTMHGFWGVWLLGALLLCAVWFLWRACSPLIASALLAAAFVLLGAGMTAFQARSPVPDDLRFLPPGVIQITGYLSALPAQTSYGWQAPFRLTARAEDRQWLPAAGTISLSGHGEAPPSRAYVLVSGQTLPAGGALNPYGFSWAEFLAERGYTYRVAAESYRILPGLAPVSPLLPLRAFLSVRLAATMPVCFGPRYAQLLEGLLLGVHGAPLPEDITESFRRAGTIHLMVVSGSQVTLLGSLLLLPLGLLAGRHGPTSFPRARMLLLLATLPLLGLYIALADRGPSVDRALITFLLMVLALFLAFSPLARRRAFHPDSVTLLAAAGLITLICRPALLFSPSLQLTYAAVLGLILLTPIFMRLLVRWPSWLALLPAATLGAEIMTLPVLAWYFGRLPVLGVFSNLVAVPVVGLLLPLGLLTLLLAVVAPPLAVALNYLNGPLLSLLLALNQTIANISWGQVNWYVRSPGPLLAYSALVTLGMILLSRLAHRIQQEWAVPAGSTPPMW